MDKNGAGAKGVTDDTINDRINDNDDTGDTISNDGVNNNVDHIPDITQQYYTNGRPVCMSWRHIKDTKNGRMYTFVAADKAISYGLGEDTPAITAFLHANNTYANSLRK